MTGKTEILGQKKPVPVQFCPSQIPHGLAWWLNEGLRGASGRPTPEPQLGASNSLKVADKSYVSMQRLSMEGTG